MRLALVLVLMSVLSTHGPALAQGAGNPGPASRPQRTAPPGHHQPRPADVPPVDRPTSDSSISTDNNPNRADNLEDARLNRILNGICRGC